MVAEAKMASTVIPMRDGTEGPEVFLVKRTRKVAFMAGAHVYPGGRVDPEDHTTPATGGDHAKQVIGSDAAHGFAVAAVRELYEEAGILLADGALPDTVRNRLNAGQVTFDAVCEDHQVRLDLDQIAPWAHWITPEAEARRYDTWFFVAKVEPGTAARHDDGETVASLWIRPADAIEACREGKMFLAPPTWTTLDELTPYGSVDEILAASHGRQIISIMPVLRSEAGQVVIILPGDPENPAERSVDGPTRLRWTDEGWEKAWAPNG